MDNVLKTLKRLLKADQIKENEPMAKHTSFKVGGPADLLVVPQSQEEFLAVLELLKAADAPFYIIGKGTNLLVRDKGFRGVIVKTTGLTKVRLAEDKLIAEPGISLKDLADLALAESLTGLEFASGIPGSLGGGVTMNAGAYDGEMKNVIEAIEVLDQAGNVFTLRGDDCRFAYRSSIIQEEKYILLSVNLSLRKGDYNRINEKMIDLNAKRWAKQPLDYPSAGSTFRRPEGYFAGKLIQDAGFKGYSLGGAQVSNKHSGFVINTGTATTADILNLIKSIQAGVLKEFGVALKTEVIVIGEEWKYDTTCTPIPSGVMGKTPLKKWSSRAVRLA